MDRLIEVLKQSSPVLYDTATSNLQNPIQDSCVDTPTTLLKMTPISNTSSSSLLPAPAIGIIIFASIVITLLLLIQFVLLPSFKRSKGYLNHLLQHAVITGGSSGIGFAIAKELVRKKCSYITLIARGEMKLKAAQIMLQTFAKEMDSPTIVTIYPVDVTDASAMQQCAKDICISTSKATRDTIPSPSIPPTLLFNVAGTAIAKEFLHTQPSDFEKLMTLNYLGSVYTTQAFLPFMLHKSTGTGEEEKSKMKKGVPLPKTIVFTSSAAGQVGVYGYSAYSPTKYALRGLAEVLQMELLLENICVQIAYPPDTDTPGYQLEQVEKPKVTQLISETAGLFQPDMYVYMYIYLVLPDIIWILIVFF